MPPHMERNTQDSRFVWDANHGRWIMDPRLGPNQISVPQAMSGFMQTPGAQQAYSDAISPALVPLSPPGGGIMRDVRGTAASRNLVGSDPDGTGAGGRLINFRNPQTGETKRVNLMSEMDTLIKGGWRPEQSDGSPMRVEQFGGGYLFDGVPINVAQGLGWQPGQRESLISAGRNPADGTILGIPGGGQQPQPQPQPTYTPSPNVGGFTGEGMPSGAADLFRYLTQTALNRGQVLPDDMNLSGLYRAFTDAMGSNAGQRDNLIDYILHGRAEVPGVSGAVPGIAGTMQGFLDRANTSEGLTPEARAALNLEVQEGLPQRYNEAASNLATSLLRRGAGGGQMPADAGALLRGYGPLQEGLANERSRAGRQVILADEDMKRASLLSNRQMAQNAIGMGSNLISTFGNIYNPEPWAGYGLGAINAATNAYGAGTGGLNAATAAAGGLGELEPTSFRNLLLASLLSTGTNAINNNPQWITSIINAIGGLFGGGGGNGSQPVYTGQGPTVPVQFPPPRTPPIFPQFTTGRTYAF